MRNPNWTYDEVLLALYAYCHVPFNRASNSHPWIVKIANVIGRSPVAVKMKIGNLGNLDPTLRERGITGLTSTSRVDRQVWGDYFGHWDKLAEDAERLIDEYIALHPEQTDFPEGRERITWTKARINQSFFRSSILAAYNTTCCVSGISAPELIEAAHIISWHDDSALRTDPTNGLCLNPLFHKAYDSLLISVSPDYELKISDAFLDSISKPDTLRYIRSLNGHSIDLPNRFLPNRDNLSVHYEKFLSA